MLRPSLTQSQELVLARKRNAPKRPQRESDPEPTKNSEASEQSPEEDDDEVPIEHEGFDDELDSFEEDAPKGDADEDFGNDDERADEDEDEDEDEAENDDDESVDGKDVDSGYEEEDR